MTIPDAAQPTDAETPKLCPACGYDLRDIASPRCPECGLVLGQQLFSPIPWAHRWNIGRIKAFIRTVLRVTFRPKKFAEAVNWPIDFAAAERFRWIVVVLASLPMLATIILVMLMGGTQGIRILKMDQLIGVTYGLGHDYGLRWDLFVMWFDGISWLPTLPLGVLVMFGLSTAAPTIWFTSRKSLPLAQQNRAIALSRYASAPLAGLPLVSIGVFVIALCGSLDVGDIPKPLVWLLGAVSVATGISLFGIVFASWWIAMRLLSATTQAGWSRLRLAAIGIPIGWIVCGIVGLGLVPCMVGSASLMIQSFKWIVSSQ